jgi:hypothetical protein
LDRGQGRPALALSSAQPLAERGPGRFGNRLGRHRPIFADRAWPRPGSLQPGRPAGPAAVDSTGGTVAGGGGRSPLVGGMSRTSLTELGGLPMSEVAPRSDFLCRQGSGGIKSINAPLLGLARELPERAPRPPSRHPTTSRAMPRSS